MRVKDSEVQNKWCPFSRVYVESYEHRSPEGPQVVANRLEQDLPIGSNCMGSACMAWRWAAADKTGDEDLGYCGLAGLPK